eukprot:RCo020388
MPAGARWEAAQSPSAAVPVNEVQLRASLRTALSRLPVVQEKTRCCLGGSRREIEKMLRGRERQDRLLAQARTHLRFGSVAAALGALEECLEAIAAGLPALLQGPHLDAPETHKGTGAALSRAVGSVVWASERVPELPELCSVATLLQTCIAPAFAEALRPGNRRAAELVEPAVREALTEERLSEKACRQCVGEVARRFKLPWETEGAEASGQGEMPTSAMLRTLQEERNTAGLLRQLCSCEVTPEQTLPVLQARLRNLTAQLPQSAGVPITVKDRTIYRRITALEAHRGPPSRRLFPTFVPHVAPKEPASTTPKVAHTSERLLRPRKTYELPPVPPSNRLQTENQEQLTKRLHDAALVSMGKKRDFQQKLVESYKLTKSLPSEQFGDMVQRLYYRQLEQDKHRAQKQAAQAPPPAPKSPPRSQAEATQLYYERLKEREESREQLRAKYLTEPQVSRLTEEQMSALSARLSPPRQTSTPSSKAKRAS